MIIKKKLERFMLCATLNVPPSGKLIYNLLMQASGLRKEVVLSHRQIGQMIGISRSAVGNNLRKLKKAGYIDIFQNINKHGGRDDNKYRIRWLKK